MASSSLPDDDSDLVAEVAYYAEKQRRIMDEVESMLDDPMRIRSEDPWKIGTRRERRTTLRIG